MQFIFRLTKTSLLATLLIALSLAATGAYAEAPRLVISQLELPPKLTARERSAVKQIDFVQALREALLDSRSFTVLTRENRTVQTILEERKIADSSLARDSQDQSLGLDIAEYFLQLSLTRFDIDSHYQPLELLPDIYERRDSVHIELTARIFDSGGNIKFEERVEHSRHYPAVEADQNDRRRNSIRHLSSMRGDATKMVDDVAGAITTRINPITVLDVQGGLIIIDRGKNNGFDYDTKLMVYGKSKQIEHPLTGDMRMIPGARIGIARVEQLHEDVTEIKLIDGSIKDVEPGATVRVVKDKNS